MIEKNILTIAVLDAIEKSDRCPLCYLWVNNEERHMEHLLTNEVVMSPEFRDKVLVAKGFCNHHMHLLYKTAYGGHTGDGFGYALYMQGVVKESLNSLGPYLLTAYVALKAQQTVMPFLAEEGEGKHFHCCATQWSKQSKDNNPVQLANRYGHRTRYICIRWFRCWMTRISEKSSNHQRVSASPISSQLSE